MIGKKNLYTCSVCDGQIVTVDKDDGTTPFQLGCKATQGCKGMMTSAFYAEAVQRREATHEWYKPDAEQIGRMAGHLAIHCRKGGLMIRGIGQGNA